MQVAGRLVHSADFQRALAAPARVRSAHFALHHVADTPTLPSRRTPRPAGPELSTESAPSVHRPVDDVSGWLGCVVPKRHARRAVTRSLLKRQMRSAVARHAPALRAGLWVLRLRQPFGGFRSAASTGLRDAVRAELDALLLQSSNAAPA